MNNTRRIVFRVRDDRQHRSPIPVAENIVSRSEIERGVDASTRDLIDELRRRYERRKMGLKNIGDLQAVIGWQRVEEMLAQHDHYSFGRVSVGCGESEAWWYVYVGNKEHHVYENEAAEPRGYATLAEALEVALDPGNQEMWFDDE